MRFKNAGESNVKGVSICEKFYSGTDGQERRNVMTLRQIRESDKIYLTAADIADIVESDASSIRRQAQEDPGKLGFPVIVIGNRVKIPREGFLYFLQYGHPKV